MEFSDALTFLEQEHSSIVTTVGRSGRLQSTIVRAGPYEGGMAFVVRGGTIKLKNVKRDERCTVLVVKPDWSRFATIEGRAETHSWDDTDNEELRMMLRRVFAAAGGTHDNWEEFDRVMREEQRAVVLVSADRVYGRV